MQHHLLNDIIKDLQDAVLSLVEERTQNIVQRLLNESRQLVRYQLFDVFFRFFAEVTSMQWTDLSMAVINSRLKIFCYILALCLQSCTFRSASSFSKASLDGLGIAPCISSMAM